MKELTTLEYLNQRDEHVSKAVELLLGKDARMFFEEEARRECLDRRHHPTSLLLRPLVKE